MDPEEMAAITKTLRVPPDTMLDAEHLAVLVRAIRNVVAAEEAVFTFAQIVDGLPTGDVACDRRTHHLTGDHPLDEHEELCPGALDRARELCGQWRTDMFAFDPQLLRAFRAAALLYQLDLRLHRGHVDAVVQWVDPLPADYKGPVLENVLPPTVFYHSLYGDTDLYPEGTADMVGYWAEDRIFGGVVVFDRRAEEADITRPARVYLHPNRKRVTGQVTQLRDEQQRALVDYLLVEDPATSACPIPILVDRDNRDRVGPEVSIVKHSIFRDVWERKPLTIAEMDVALRRPRQQIYHPEIFDTMLYSNLVLGNRLPESLVKEVKSGKRLVYSPVIKEQVIQELRKMETEKEAKRETEAPHDHGVKEEDRWKFAEMTTDEGDGHTNADDEERRKWRRAG